MSRTIADASRDQRKRIAERNKRWEAALREIASCESRHPGDVVSIARTALGIEA